MGTLTGFVVGYVVGAQHGPERMARLREACASILETPEVKQVLGDGKLADTLKAVTSSEAWQSVTSSPQVASLLENGRTLLHGVLERGMEIMTARGNGGG